MQRVRNAGIHVCCGGIVGLGETRRQRAELIARLANLGPPPESVPINNLVQVEGTPLYGTAPLDPFEFVRTIAVARGLIGRTSPRPTRQSSVSIQGKGVAGLDEVRWLKIAQN